ncbi:MAG: chorismate synthase [Oscillospiraceae bacterium]|jgi:chorismate synthase|nr:chorismate synthase [Oscillospiraceae bacterium]
MGSFIGENLRLSVFGESHGEAIGAVLDGLPAGTLLDFDKILAQMARRAPGGVASTPRKEADIPRILSGVYQNRTTGAPLAAIIQNTSARPGDYGNLADIPRPSHADYPAWVKYGGHNDVRGGGHFSGRLTATLVFAGAVCRQMLEERGVTVGGHAAQIGSVIDERFDLANVSADLLKKLSLAYFPVIDVEKKSAMLAEIEEARQNGDSVGGVVEVAATELPAGLGEPMFGGVENRLSALFFGIPAVKGVEFGSGFALSGMRGSQANDAYFMDDGGVRVKSNHNGGVLGGITTGAPLIVRLAIKPTPSIFREQESVSLSKLENRPLKISGRHDPCVVPRAAPTAEAVLAFGLLDLIISRSPDKPK